MKKLILLLITSILLMNLFQSCSDSNKDPKPSPIISVSEPDIPRTSPIPTLHLKISSIKYFKDSFVTRLNETVKMCEGLINESEYKRRLLSLVFNSKDNKGLSNVEIYLIMYHGKDLYEIGNDKTINLWLEGYWYWKPISDVTGFTKKSFKEIKLNKWNIYSKSSCFICGTLIHESLHNMGFSHPVKSRRATTVPYGIGVMTKSYCKERNK